jgi:cobalt-zinc-cadmium efflux system protein
MSHDHSQHKGNLKRIQIALGLTAGFMVVEIIGGILSGSLALLADAGHMLTDTMALALAAFAFRVSTKPPDRKRSFGYQRVQIIAAFVNGLGLLVLVGWILFEAVARFMDPPEVIGEMMLVVASAGLVINIISFVVLHGGDQENLNISGAALHVAGDLLGSVAAIAAALVILATGWMPIDPLLSVLVAALILRSAWQLVRRSAHVLLEGAPEWLNVAEMQAKIVARVAEVDSIHHVHVWGLTPQDLMLTMHVVFSDCPDDFTPLVRKVKKVLSEEFGISHSTIEVETSDCADH